MSRMCACNRRHERRRIVVTGGPGAGKTAVLELIRHSFCRHVSVLPESASILFGGGFPRTDKASDRRAAQRAIFYVQRELERAADEADSPAIVLCDRGTVDGAAYWPGPDSFWEGLETTREAQVARYQTVVHLHPLGGEVQDPAARGGSASTTTAAPRGTEGSGRSRRSARESG